MNIIPPPRSMMKIKTDNRQATAPPMDSFKFVMAPPCGKSEIWISTLGKNIQSNLIGQTYQVLNALKLIGSWWEKQFPM